VNPMPLPARRMRGLLLGAAVAFAATVALACDGGESPGASPTPAAGSPTPTATAGGSPVTGDPGSVTVYSGRSENLIGPILERFEQQSGVEVRVRYGGTAELAATLLEEGGRSPADVFIAQDAGALGAVEDAGLLVELDPSLLERVPEAFRSSAGRWVGLSGRARTVIYSTEQLQPADLPDSILEFTDPKWKGRIGWAPTNGSFQAFVTALRLKLGDDRAREWLEGVQANEPKEYPNNTSIVQAAAAGEIEVGFVNHYYLHRFVAEEGEDFPARNHYTSGGDFGTLINVAGAGILESADSKEAAQRMLDFLLSEEAQRYFAEETFEYPVVDGVEANADVRSIREINAVDVDLSRLEDLQGTLALLRETGVLP
jgi:iron(III) transport system substrate-binding protein